MGTIAQRILVPCSASKSADLHIWKCQRCKKFTNIRKESVLSGKKLPLKTLITLLFYLCSCSLTNVEVEVSALLLTPCWSRKGGGDRRGQVWPAEVLPGTLKMLVVLMSCSLSFSAWPTLEALYTLYSVYNASRVPILEK